MCLFTYTVTKNEYVQYTVWSLISPTPNELVFDSYEWWTSCIKAIRELTAGLKLSLNKSATKHITAL